VQAFKVGATTCSLRSFYFTNASGLGVRKKPYLGPLLQDIAFRPGQMHYLGDFSGKRAQKSTGYSIETLWNVTDVRDNYADTTSAILSVLPKARVLKAVNQMSVSSGAVTKSNVLRPQ
jgi:hypothetical protein